MDNSWECKEPFVFQVKVEGHDIDGLQHANNASYVSWCEQAAWAHSESLGLGVKDFQSLDRAMAIRHAHYDYVAASYLGDELLVATWLEGVSKLKMTRHFEMKKSRCSTTILRASWQLVCIEISTGHPKRLPPEFLATYGSGGEGF